MGFDTVSWSTANRTYALVGAVPHDRLAAMAAAFRLRGRDGGAGGTRD
jgi:hypothetical protein